MPRGVSCRGPRDLGRCAVTSALLVRGVCKVGHPMTPENTYMYQGREPRCRACGNAATRAWRARQKAGVTTERSTAQWRAHAFSSPLDRIMAQVVKSGDYWEWTGFTTPQGYGATSFKGRRGTLVHRAVYELLVGPIPDGMTLDHLCHTRDESCPGGDTCPHRRCVNPACLEPVPNVVNAMRGRSAWAENARKTHCPHGHEYSEANTLISNGRRYCRICQRRQGAASRERARARRTAVAA